MTVPPRYPTEDACDVVLRDGATVHLRPIRESDAEKLLRLFERLSPESLHFRFFVIPKADATKAAYLATVDYENQYALVAEVGDEVVGVARYYRSKENPGEAEAAFTVADALHGHGLGTRLLERLAVIARRHGIRTFTAEVLAENRKMLDVFGSAGFEITHRLEGYVFHVSISLEPTSEFAARSAERAQKAAAASLVPFFRPRSVAVVGASRRPGQIGYEVLRNLRGTFTGQVFAVNPAVTEIDGLRVYEKTTDIAEDVDLAVITVPADKVDGVLDDVLAKGVRAVVVITAGFGELGTEGRRREAALLAKVRAAGARMLGPNVMGLLNTDPAIQLNATFVPLAPPRGRVAMSSQSGALGVAVLDLARRLNIGLSSFVSIGNKADISGNDLIQYWAEDPDTDVILLYVESFGNPATFSRLARRIARKKPIVAVKSGRSNAGARAASSHTGALAARDTVVDALLRQAGVVRTRTLEELFDVTTLLAHQPVPKGSRVAILTNAGGPAILATDACEAEGLTLPMPSPATVDALRQFLPPAASVGNPVDMLASATADNYRTAMKALLADDAFDSLLVIFIPPLPHAAAVVAPAIVEGAAGNHGKTVLATFLAERGASALGSIPCYTFPESAATALARVAAYGAWLRRSPGEVPTFADLDVSRARQVVDEVVSRGGGWLTPLEADALLASHGIPVAKSGVAKSAREAAKLAEQIGFPVALKAVGPKILHKSDVGGVKLSLHRAAAVKRAYGELASRLGGDLQSVYVQEMVTGSVELMAGALLDPLFGPLVVYGSGGVHVELIGDVTFKLHPITDIDAREMLDEAKGTVLLRGFRGAPAIDEAPVRELLLRLSALLTSCPEIHEMDLNPLKVLATGVKVVDARIRVDRRPPAPRTRRIQY